MTLSTDGLYSNLAEILSDQCCHTTKVAVFADAANTEFRDSKEFGGSVFEQLDSVFSYLTLCNKTSASFKGLERIEKQDYPEEALREALLNAIVHRDYSFSGSIIINPAVQAGENCSLHGANCIGNNGLTADVPVLGNGVDLGYGAVIIGKVTIADGVKIGANAVVNRSILEPGCTVAGVPAGIVKCAEEK